MAEKESALQHEIGQTRPFRSTAQEAVVGLLRTASLLRHRFAAVVEPHQITFQQYNVLRILQGAGLPLPTMEIGRWMIEPTPGITRFIDRLEAKGLVRRESHPQDRRHALRHHAAGNATHRHPRPAHHRPRRRECAEMKAVTVGDGDTMVEWFFDYTHAAWGERTYHQVSVQRWEDGQIVHERF